MARDFDPKNLSAGDVLRAIGPLVAFLAALVLVGRFAPDYIWLLIVGIGVFVYFYVTTLPKENIAAMVDKEREINEKIDKIPVVGRIVGPLWRALNWLGAIVGSIFLVWFIYVSIKNLM